MSRNLFVFVDLDSRIQNIPDLQLGVGVLSILKHVFCKKPYFALLHFGFYASLFRPINFIVSEIHFCKTFGKHVNVVIDHLCITNA